MNPDKTKWTIQLNPVKLPTHRIVYELLFWSLNFGVVCLMTKTNWGVSKGAEKKRSKAYKYGENECIHESKGKRVLITVREHINLKVNWVQIAKIWLGRERTSFNLNRDGRATEDLRAGEDRRPEQRKPSHNYYYLDRLRQKLLLHWQEAKQITAWFYKRHI